MEERKSYKEEKLGNFIIDIAAGPFGSNLKVDCFVPDGFPIIDGANLKGFKVTDNVTKFVTEEKARSLHRSIAKRNDVVVTISGNVGQISFIPMDSKYPEYLVSQRQFRATFDERRVYVPYLVYYFHTKEGQHKILSFANQTGVPALAQPLKNFRNIDISLPDLQTQKQIARILESLDNKIELNNRINHNLEEQARSLYKSWFIDFEPFKDGKFVDSELGMIPEGWHIGTLSEIADITMGQSPSGSSFNEDGHGIVFYQGRTEFGFRFPSIKLFTTEPTRFAEPHSVLMSVRAPVGDINVALDRCCIGRGLAAITAKDEAFPFVLYTLKGKSSELDLYNGEGTVFGSINRKELEGLSILIPPRSIIQRFNDCIKPVDDSIEIACKEIVSLSYSRDSILPKLMSGQLPLDELDC